MLLVVQEREPGLDKTVYPVTEDPPLLIGAFQETVDREFSPLVAVTAVGEPGLVAATTNSGSSVKVITTLPSTVAVAT